MALFHHLEESRLTGGRELDATLSSYTAVSRSKRILLLAVLLILASYVSCHFGPQYEMDKFDPNAQQVLEQSGESFFIGLRWTLLGMFCFVSGVALALYVGRDWRQRRKKA